MILLQSCTQNLVRCSLYCSSQSSYHLVHCSICLHNKTFLTCSLSVVHASLSTVLHSILVVFLNIHIMYVTNYTLQPVQCCGSGQFFFRTRICGFGFEKSDPNLYSDLTQICFFYVQQKTIFSWHFLTKCKHLITLKIKDNKLF